ncbi:MAG: response regulator transcription factor [Candidatus Acidiferrales bacterium]|jgi:NarL family two-component system response regulator YdfI
MTRVLIAAESSISQRGLEGLIPEDSSIEIVGSVDPASGDIAHEIEDLRPDVIVLERRIFDEDALASMFPAEDASGPRIVLLTDQVTGELARDALRAGVRAILQRDAAAEEILAAIEAAAAGLIALNPETLDAAFAVPTNGLRSAANGASGTPSRSPATALSPRETEILQMIAEGFGNKEIAWRLKISDHTVKYHISSIFTKLDVSSRTEAVTLGVRLGIILL